MVLALLNNYCSTLKYNEILSLDIEVLETVKQMVTKFDFDIERIYTSRSQVVHQ